MAPSRWDTDERGQGVADARFMVPAIQELQDLATADRWVAEEPQTHLLPGIEERVAISGLRLEEQSTDDAGVLHVRLSSGIRLSRGEIRQSVWLILGGAVEMTTFVRETSDGDAVTFEVVTGVAPGGRFATHGHTLRIQVVQPA